MEFRQQIPPSISRFLKGANFSHNKGNFWISPHEFEGFTYRYLMPNEIDFRVIKLTGTRLNWRVRGCNWEDVFGTLSRASPRGCFCENWAAAWSPTTTTPSTLIFSVFQGYIRYKNSTPVSLRKTFVFTCYFSPYIRWAKVFPFPSRFLNYFSFWSVSLLFLLWISYYVFSSFVRYPPPPL